MTALGISEALDLTIKDPLVALIKVFVLVIYSYVCHSRESQVIAPQVEVQEVEAEMDISF